MKVKPHKQSLRILERLEFLIWTKIMWKIINRMMKTYQSNKDSQRRNQLEVMICRGPLSLPQRQILTEIALPKHMKAVSSRIKTMRSYLEISFARMEDSCHNYPKTHLPPSKRHWITNRFLKKILRARIWTRVMIEANRLPKMACCM